MQHLQFIYVEIPRKASQMQSMDYPLFVIEYDLIIKEILSSIGHICSLFVSILDKDLCPGLTKLNEFFHDI